MVRTSKQIWIPSGCRATSGMFVMIHDHSIRMESNIVTSPFRIKFEQDWLKKFNASQEEVLNVLRKVHDDLETVKMPVTSVKEKIAMLRVIQQTKNNSSRLSILKVGLWLLLAVSFVVGAISIYFKFIKNKKFSCLNCKGRTSTKHETPPNNSKERSTKTIQQTEEGFYESVRMSELES